MRPPPATCHAPPCTESCWAGRYLKRRIHDYTLWLDLEDRGISRSLLLFGTREVEHKVMLEGILEAGMTVFDIGANIGYYTVMQCRLIGPTGRLVAIEPAPANAALLRRNLALNGYADTPIVEAAVSEAAGERAFHLAHQSNLGTFHDTGSGAVHLTGETITVATTTVPALADIYGPPDLIRMDVEGHEVAVIRGMLDAIAAGAFKPAIIVETHLSRYDASHDMAGPLARLFELGYGVRALASSWQRGTELIAARGYAGSSPIATDGVERVFFNAIGNDDAIDFICRTGGARMVLLATAD